MFYREIDVFIQSIFILALNNLIIILCTNYYGQRSRALFIMRIHIACSFIYYFSIIVTRQCCLCCVIISSISRTVFWQRYLKRIFVFETIRFCTVHATFRIRF